MVQHLLSKQVHKNFMGSMHFAGSVANGWDWAHSARSMVHFPGCGVQRGGKHFPRGMYKAPLVRTATGCTGDFHLLRVSVENRVCLMSYRLGHHSENHSSAFCHSQRPYPREEAEWLRVGVGARQALLVFHMRWKGRAAHLIREPEYFLNIWWLIKMRGQRWRRAGI